MPDGAAARFAHGGVRPDYAVVSGSVRPEREVGERRRFGFSRRRTRPPRRRTRKPSRGRKGRGFFAGCRRRARGPFRQARPQSTRAPSRAHRRTASTRGSGRKPRRNCPFRACLGGYMRLSESGSRGFARRKSANQSLSANIPLRRRAGGRRRQRGRRRIRPLPRACVRVCRRRLRFFSSRSRRSARKAPRRLFFPAAKSKRAMLLKFPFSRTMRRFRENRKTKFPCRSAWAYKNGPPQREGRPKF